jgi:hypothetical protein
VTGTSALLEAFRRIREAAESHMDERDQADVGWSEESVTEASTHKGLPQVKVVPFNRNQEGGGIGADYLWWWLDTSSAECFGMLVQAKRLARDKTKWKLDIRHEKGKQYAELLSTAAYFNAPAVYAIYTGGLVFRADLPCLHAQGPGCLTCRRMAVSVITAYQLSAVASPADTADLMLNDSIPLEDLVDPDLAAGPVHDLNHPNITSDELRSFLLDEQSGPREIAKRIFKAVSAQRSSSFSAALAESTPVLGAPVFPDAPADPGHFPGPYFPHVLGGLRTAPPDYLFDVLAGQPVPPEVAQRAAGLVLVYT